QRVSGRAVHGLQLARAKRRLAAAETELGELGWQQADYYDAATQSEVKKLHDVEREQARLTNASATLAHEIRALSDERDRVRKEAEAKRVGLETERIKLREPLTTLEGQLADIRR